MANGSVFDNLVGELSANERHELLERVRRSVDVSGEPLLSEEGMAARDRPDRGDRIESYSFFERIILYLRRIFTGRDLETLMTEDELKSLARAVEQKCPGLIDYHRNVLLAPFLEELQRLRDSARFFYDVLERSFDRDKAAFFGFLGSLELPETHAALLAGTDPSAYLLGNPDAPEADLRQATLSAYEDAFQNMLENRRKQMYQDLRCLLFLKRLSSFLFERCISLFKPGVGPDGGVGAYFSEARELLVELGDILCSLSTPPTVELMECLFAFADHEEIERLDENAETLLKDSLGKAELALARVRSFNRRVPFFDILRLVCLDPDHRPQELPAGEDWLVVYRGFWKARMERRLDEVREERHYKRLSEEITSFIGEGEPSRFANISRTESPDAPAIRQDLALAFIDAFVRGAFAREFNRPLKLVLVDGEFYRKENRLEFTDAYNALVHAPDAIAFLDARLAPEGEIGKAWSQAKREASPLAIKRRKIQSIARGADDEAERIIRETGAALAEIVRIVRGILKGEAGGRYDSLANLSYLDGRANKDFLKSLANVKDRAERALGLLGELSGFELDSPVG